MKRTTILGCFVLFILGVGNAYSQEAISGSGGEASGTGGTSSYTVGQVAYVTKAGTSFNIAEGVQQPYEISETLGFQEQDIVLELQAFPNPTTDVLTLTSTRSNLNYKLVDSKGALIYEGDLNDSKTQINMKDLDRAIYFIHVEENRSSIKTFKIIKN